MAQIQAGALSTVMDAMQWVREQVASGRVVVAGGRICMIGARDGGMASGKPSCLIAVELDDGTLVIGEQSMRNVVASAAAFKGVYPDVDGGPIMLVRKSGLCRRCRRRRRAHPRAPCRRSASRRCRPSTLAAAVKDFVAKSGHQRVDPPTLEAYNEKYQKGIRVSGFGLEVTQSAPCPGCAEPGFLTYRIMEVRSALEKETVCKCCDRGFRADFVDAPGSTSFEIVQTVGPDMPAYLPMIRRAGADPNAS